MSKPEQPTKVTLEDLLRLKRAERPNPEFWSNFERELRQKQLTALVQKRRWWHELPVLLNRRVYMPAGAVAVVAFTLVTIRYSVPTQVAQVPNTAPRIVAADPAIETLATTVVTDQGQSGSREETSVVASVSAPAVTVADNTAAYVPTQLVSREAGFSSVRPLTASLAHLEQSDLMDSVVGSQLSVPARVQPAAAAEQSEVAAMTNASGPKYRLIARYADRSLSPAPAAPAVVRERLARRLGDDLGDGISRIGVVGSRVSLKF